MANSLFTPEYIGRICLYAAREADKNVISYDVQQGIGMEGAFVYVKLAIPGATWVGKITSEWFALTEDDFIHKLEQTWPEVFTRFDAFAGVK